MNIARLFTPPRLLVFTVRLATCTAVALLSTPRSAPADIIFGLANAPVSTGDGYYAYTYNVQLTSGQLDPVSGGSPVQFGTLYDFGPLVTTAGVTNNVLSPDSVFISKTGLLADGNNQFTFSFNRVDPLASSAAGTVSINDDINLANVRLTYTGSRGIDVSEESTTLSGNPVTINEGNANLGTFTVYSPYALSTSLLAYDGQTYKGTNNTLEANQGGTFGPQNPVSTVPDTGATWGLLLAGVGLCGVARRLGFATPA